MPRMKQSTHWWIAAVSITVAFLGVLFTPAWRGEQIAQAGDAGQPGVGQRTVFIGFSGVHWADVSEEHTPALASLVPRGASSNLVVKTLGVSTCPNAGWLTISQGVRAADPVEKGCAKPVIASPSGVLPAKVERARIDGEKTSPFSPPSTTFGDELAERNITVGTVGSGAALAARSSSNIKLPGRSHVNVTYERGVARDVAQAYRSVADADLVIVDLGRVNNADPHRAQAKDKGTLQDLRAAFAPPGARTPSATQQVREIDAELGKLLAEIEPNTTILVASVADSDPGAAHLQLMTAAGDGIKPGTLAFTNSTRHHGLVQLTDVPQAIMMFLGHRPIADFVGSPVAMRDGAEMTSESIMATLRDADARAIAVRPAVGPFYLLMSLSAGVFLAWFVVRWWKAGRRPELSAGHRFFGLVVAMLPAGSFLANLVPWWRAPMPTFAFLGGVVLIGVVVAAVSLRLAEPAGLVALVSAAVIGLDVILGSGLHASSVLGDQPQQGGRFYGLSNAPFTVFALAMIYVTFVAVRALRGRHERLVVPAAVIALGMIAVVIDGSGALGADFGGVPALVAAYLVIFVVMVGRGLTARSVSVIVVCAAVAALFGAFVDWLRPESSWTHMGRFFQSLIDGEAAVIIYRKFMFMVGSAPWFVWVALAVLFAWGWVRRAKVAAVFGVRGGEAVSTSTSTDPLVLRPPAATATAPHRDDLRWGVRAMIALVVVGVAVNDSGLVIALLGVVFGAPLVLVTRRGSEA